MEGCAGELALSPQDLAVPGRGVARPRERDMAARRVRLPRRCVRRRATRQRVGAPMRDRARRAIAECRNIATMTEEPGRITRRFLTQPAKQAHAYLRGRMEGLGMT